LKIYTNKKFLSSALNSRWRKSKSTRFEDNIVFNLNKTSKMLAAKEINFWKKSYGTWWTTSKETGVKILVILEN